jgi:hypothetical protein
MCCVRVPDEAPLGRRLQEVRPYSTMTRSLVDMADHLASLGVTRVVMEATSDYWKPVFYLLEAAGFDTWLVNAKDVKHLPGRPRPTGWMSRAASGTGNRWSDHGRLAQLARRTETTFSTNRGSNHVPLTRAREPAQLAQPRPPSQGRCAINVPLPGVPWCTQRSPTDTRNDRSEVI